jgi:hypothetical protein
VAAMAVGAENRVMGSDQHLSDSRPRGHGPRPAQHDPRLWPSDLPAQVLPGLGSSFGPCDPRRTVRGDANRRPVAHPECHPEFTRVSVGRRGARPTR